MKATARGLSKQQKAALAVLSFAGAGVFYASAFSGWFIVLVFPIAYAIVVVRSW